MYIFLELVHINYFQFKIQTHITVNSKVNLLYDLTNNLSEQQDIYMYLWTILPGRVCRVSTQYSALMYIFSYR